MVMANVSFDFTILDKKSGESVFMLNPETQEMMLDNELFCDDYQVYVQTLEDIDVVIDVIISFYDMDDLDIRFSKCVDGIVTEYDSFEQFKIDVFEYENSNDYNPDAIRVFL